MRRNKLNFDETSLKRITVRQNSNPEVYEGRINEEDNKKLRLRTKHYNKVEGLLNDEERINTKGSQVWETTQRRIETRSGRILHQSRIEMNQSATRTTDQSQFDESLRVHSKRANASFAFARTIARSHKYQSRKTKFVHSSADLHQDAILLRREMPNIKFTKRKEAAFACSESEGTFRQRKNYLRHLGIIHGKDKAGEHISDEALDRMKSYNAKKKTQGPPAKKPKKSIAVVEPSSSSSLRPAGHSRENSAARQGSPGRTGTTVVAVLRLGR